MSDSIKVNNMSKSIEVETIKNVNIVDEVDDVDDDDDDDVDDVEIENCKGFTKPAITRLARRAGVKSMSDECIVPLRHLVAIKLDEILRTTLIVNSQHATKTIMPDDVYEAFSLCGINVARTEEF
jgi:histone H3/H4